MAEYILKRSKRSRSIRISLNPSGQVVVRAPKYVSLAVIERFVESQAGWIAAHQQRLLQQKAQYPLMDEAQGLCRYLGQLYRVEFVEMGEKMVFDHEAFILRVHPVTGLEQDVWPTIKKWLKLEAQRVLHQECRQWAQKMNVNYSSISITNTRSRWGSCSSTGALRFTWKLIHFPLSVLQYVVVHELAHRLEMNHQDRFWKVVQQAMPDYKHAMVFLKRVGMGEE